MVPKGLNAFLTFVHAAETAIQVLALIQGPQKYGIFEYCQIL